FSLDGRQRCDRRPRRKNLREVLRIDAVHSREIVDVVEVDVGGDDVGEGQSRFFEAIEKVPHRLSYLRFDGRGIDSLHLVRSGHEWALGRTEIGVAGKDTRAG